MATSESSPSSEADARSLAHQINTAIASSHTKINRLILDRMPKAVPPQTDNPSTYITGLLHIGAVYVAFESLWQNLLGVHSEIAPIPYSFPFSNHPNRQDETPQITERLRRVLEEAYWPNLLRAPRIKADVQAMTGWPDHVYDEQLRSAGTSGRLGKFTLHIRDSVNAKPHLLLAYAYCLYLALLSGGSYIRTELTFLNEDFWTSLPTPIKPNMVECRQDKVKPRRHSSSGHITRHSKLAPHDSSLELPLDFLNFDPPLGENHRQQTKVLKADFKQRFAEAEQLLADPERQDIVKESTAVFHHLEGVVVQLDKIIGTDTDAQPLKTHAQRVLNPLSRPGGIGFRLRDSIAIAKGRLLRTRRKSSEYSVTATVPAIADKLSVTDSQRSESSKPSSVSERQVEDEDVDEDEQESAESNEEAQPDAEEKQLDTETAEARLARDAVVPADGFRTIRYDNDLPKPTRSTTPPTGNGRGKANGHANGHTKAKQAFDGANSDVECCPISRPPAMAIAAVQTRPEPNYALYVIISNFVTLFGVAGFFAAYLYMRHGDDKPRAGTVEL